MNFLPRKGSEMRGYLIGVVCLLVSILFLCFSIAVLFGYL